jgi:hypothetical protein
MSLPAKLRFLVSSNQGVTEVTGVTNTVEKLRTFGLSRGIARSTVKNATNATVYFTSKFDGQVSVCESKLAQDPEPAVVTE